ncbi:divalent-cation tolerance protein CutA [Paucibacter sp. APW11]|uniref:Divalent-cation tolerance protein CutA n=1 Tax=Roseateles aquae TaxID=3077235 RepID=A0ABU3PH19_9BURK|nr:divalent-cation tolerance protein CutA [Paucibacter sp. APW11]MDT9001869.1 divalent-cation tolerance protein CutA [Paucibacter sp. APW11]
MHPSDHPLLVITSITGLDAARALARAMVEQGLAACAQLQAIESVYVWQGKLCQGEEQRILFKTRVGQQAALEAAIRALHSDELPALYVLKPDAMLPEFADWIARQTGG